MDESTGMNYSEYVAILSGNTGLLEKAKIEKHIAGGGQQQSATGNTAKTAHHIASGQISQKMLV